MSLDALSRSLSAVSLLFDVVVEVDEGSSDVIAAVVSEADTSGSVDAVADSWGEGGGGLEETTSQVPLSTKRKYNRGKVVVVVAGGDLSPAIFSLTGVAERRAAGGTGGRLSPDTDAMDWLYSRNIQAHLSYIRVE